MVLVWCWSWAWRLPFHWTLDDKKSGNRRWAIGWFNWFDWFDWLFCFSLDVGRWTFKHQAMGDGQF
jgi:hypothetical protein